MKILQRLITTALCIALICSAALPAFALGIYFDNSLGEDYFFIGGLEPDDYVARVKYEIEQQMGISTERQVLIYSGEILDDDKCLSDYSITEGDTHIKLIVLEGSSVQGSVFDIYIVEADTVYCLNVDWGAMEFTYNTGGRGVWNSETLKYDNATTKGWSVNTENGDLIKITNNSNADVQVSFSYTGADGFEDIGGTFSSVGGVSITNGTATLPSAEGERDLPFVTAKLSLDGTVPEMTANSQEVIGTLTVVVSPTA